MAKNKIVKEAQVQVKETVVGVLPTEGSGGQLLVQE